ncbi:MAG: hypothetical protein IAE77_02355 [Prosthecobacter sp.]|jgi:hypothetical protein|uniref:hypothetical protein n=1 Tax=Prosthecobacter sp. TaxID=1965333 RepID=UPI0019DD7517|nr:hypothetical protein [Prosthecobacter sp.]MBE2282286.1 hypothetical protein [Prosthecobacter sp.]
MNSKAVVLLLTLGFTCAVVANTLDQLGMRDAFGSEDQVATLKKLASDHPDDEFIAITWSISMTDKSVVESLLFYERTSKKLWRAKSVRVGSDRLKPQWVGWTDVTDEKIQALKNSEGFELPGFHTGEGSVPLSDAAASFLKKALSKKKARN